MGTKRESRFLLVVQIPLVEGGPVLAFSAVRLFSFVDLRNIGTKPPIFNHTNARRGGDHMVDRCIIMLVLFGMYHQVYLQVFLFRQV